LAEGIGIDLVEVSRIAEMIKRPGFLERVFTPAEIKECRSFRHSAQSFAARFAAKEAVGKALGTGIGGKLSWQDVEILRTEHGSPIVNINASSIEQLNNRTIKISLSHTNNYAVAVAIIDKG
jgi:holo-[acyl-carrier protein] synthase